MTKRSVNLAPFVFLGILSLYPVFLTPVSLSIGEEAGRSNAGFSASAGNVAVLVFDLSARGGTVFDETSLRMMEDLDQRLFNADWVRGYRGPLNATVVKSDETDILVLPFIPASLREHYSERVARDLEDAYGGYPELAPYINPDFSAAAFYVEPGISLSSSSLYRELEDLRRTIREAHGMSFDYTGVLPVRAHIERYLTQDAARIIPIQIGLVSLVYLVGFGSVRILGLAWLSKTLATLASYACYRVFFSNLSPLLILIPTFNFGLLSDYLIHAFYHSTRTLGIADPGSVRRYLGVPLTLTAATSVIGFASLALFSDAGHVMLAVTVSISILLTYVLALWWCQRWAEGIRPSRFLQRGVRLGRIRRVVTRQLTKVLIATHRRRTIVLIAAGALIVLSATQLPKLRAEPYPVKQLPPDSTVVVAENLLVDEFSGTIPFTLEIDAGSAGALLRAESLRTLKQIHSIFAENNEIGFHRSVLSVVERMHYYFNGSDPDYLDIPSGLDDDRFMYLVEQYLLFYSASASPDEYESLIDAEFQATAIQGILRYRSGESLNRLQDTIDRARAVAPADWHFRMDGVAATLIARQRSLEGNWYISLSVGCALIFLTVLVLYRNAAMALLGLVPSIAILVCIAGLCSLLRISIDDYTIIVVAVCIGLTVDYTIHMLNAIRVSVRARRGVVSYSCSVVRRAGVPIFLSLLTSVFAFLSLCLSSFSGAVSFAVLLSLSIIAAFCIGVFVLPVLFARTFKEVSV